MSLVQSQWSQVAELVTGFINLRLVYIPHHVFCNIKALSSCVLDFTIISANCT